MNAYERERVCTVRFDEADDNGLIGKIEGDSTSVLVQEGIQSPCLGDAWICKLIVDDGPNGIIYIATLMEKVDEAVYSVDGGEQYVEESPTESTEKTDAPKEEFKIDEVEETKAESAVPKKTPFKLRNFVSYEGITRCILTS